MDKSGDKKGIKIDQKRKISEWLEVFSDGERLAVESTKQHHKDGINGGEKCCAIGEFGAS